MPARVEVTSPSEGVTVNTVDQGTAKVWTEGLESDGTLTWSYVRDGVTPPTVTPPPKETP